MYGRCLLQRQRQITEFPGEIVTGGPFGSLGRSAAPRREELPRRLGFQHLQLDRPDARRHRPVGKA